MSAPERYQPYRQHYVKPQGPGDARPTAKSILKDEGLLDGGLKGKVAVVTGTSSGIGVETVRALYAAGAKVYMTVRAADKGKPVLEDIVSDKDTAGSVHILEMDLGSLASVRNAAEEFLSKEAKLNILIENAGVMACPWGKTADGFETQFGSNHLGHFLFLQLLLPALEAGARSSSIASRVVVLSSSAHHIGSVRLGDYDFKDGKEYSPWAGYGQSKTANIWCAFELNKRYGSKGINGYAAHPGGIMTALQRNLSEEDMAVWTKNPELPNLMRSTEQGAATSMMAATAKHFEGKGGVYMEDCGVAVPGEECDPKGVVTRGYAKYVYGQDEGYKQLWEDSLKMVGLT